jgi:hypothetical protein
MLRTKLSSPAKAAGVAVAKAADVVDARSFSMVL